MNRRNLLAGVAAAAIAAAAGLYRFTDIFVKHYPPTPYDDLLDRLADRVAAKRIGAAVPNIDAAQAAAKLRQSMGGKSLSAAMDADIAAGRMTEVAGWQMPESLALLAALAART